MGEEQNTILTIQYEDNTVEKRELLSIFKGSNDQEYAALLQLDDNENVLEKAAIELVRINRCVNDDLTEGYVIEAITTDEETQIAKAAFSKLAMAGEDENNLEDLSILTFCNGNGEMEDWRIVDIFDYKDNKYVALIPVSDNLEISIHLMRIVLTQQDGIEGCEVYSIPSNIEYEEVAEVFRKRTQAPNYN